MFSVLWYFIIYFFPVMVSQRKYFSEFFLPCTSPNNAVFLAASASGKKKFHKDVNSGNIIKSNQVNRN